MVRRCRTAWVEGISRMTESERLRLLGAAATELSRLCAYSISSTGPRSEKLRDPESDATVPDLLEHLALALHPRLVQQNHSRLFTLTTELDSCPVDATGTIREPVQSHRM